MRELAVGAERFGSTSMQKCPLPLVTTATLCLMFAWVSLAVPTATGAGKFWRYVRTRTLAIQMEPSATAPTVGTLRRGERVLLSGDGDAKDGKGWGRIAEGMYVRLDQLTARAP